MNKSDRISVVVGDVHGCVDELKELLNTIQFNKNQMRLVFLGDLVDRGPDPVACVRKVRELDVECIMGNHEENVLRWRKHEKNRQLTGKANPMKRKSEADCLAAEQLSDQDLTWLKSLPLKLNLGNNWWAVHAGCEPRLSLAKQIPAQIMRVRFVNPDGMAQSLNPDKSQPDGTVYWSEQWKGPENIVYGHCVHDLKNPRIDNYSFPFHTPGVTCLGIDTGCCFGGHLTAALFHGTHIEIAQVKAKRKYSTGHGDE